MRFSCAIALCAVASFVPAAGGQTLTTATRPSSAALDRYLGSVGDRAPSYRAKRPSFWTRRVEIQRQYARIAGARVPVSMSSVADVLFVGKSTFDMRYEYESINGVPVAETARK